MNKLIYSLSGLVLVAGAAHAQPAAEATGEVTTHGEAHAEASAPEAPPAADAGAPADAATGAATSALPAPSAAPAAPTLVVSDVSDAEIDSFAKATVKLQAIQADATIAADAKQAAMQAAVTEAGLDPAKYNAIGKAAQADPALRAKVQTAMARYAPPAAEG